MPIVVRTKTKRLTGDQHRVEVVALDLGIEEASSLGADEAPLPPEEETEAGESGLGSIAYDVYVQFDAEGVEDTGYSVAPDEVRTDWPTEGTKCVVWRGLPLGRRRAFLLRRQRKGAYTVEIRTEAHIRIVAGGATDTVTFPPTP